MIGAGNVSVVVLNTNTACAVSVYRQCEAKSMKGIVA